MTQFLVCRGLFQGCVVIWSLKRLDPGSSKLARDDTDRVCWGLFWARPPSTRHHHTTGSFPPFHLLLSRICAFYPRQSAWNLFIFSQKHHNHLHNPSCRHHSLPQAVKPSSL